MKLLSFTLMLCVLSTYIPIRAQTESSSSTQASAGMPNAFGLADGTPVKLRVARNMSSADSKTGETVDFEVVEEVKLGDITIIPKGGTAIGTVTHAKPKGRLGRGGKLDVNIDYVRTSIGEKIALRAVKETKGSNTTGAMTGAIVASSILFFPAAPFFLLLKGKDIKIPKGTEVSAYVSGDTELDANRYAAAGTVLENQPQTSSVGMVSVIIKSEPEGADITINGSFVGNTPSTLFVKSGEHTIVIQKEGFKAWDRFVRIDPGSNITLNATLIPD